MGDSARSSRGCYKRTGLLLFAALGTVTGEGLGAVSRSRSSGATLCASSSQRGMGFAHPGGGFLDGLLASPGNFGRLGRHICAAAAVRSGCHGASAAIMLGAGEGGTNHRKSSSGRVPAWEGILGSPARSEGTSMKASTINGFFNKGFGDPDEDGADAVNMQELELSETEGITVRIADCKMPTKRGMFRMRSYRHQGTKKVSRDGEQVLEWVDMEPIVLYKGIKGDPMKENVLVRVHDQCFTSEVMGSRRCDCREQLELAMEMVQKQGGAIIYLPQEGRGIGLANKVAAYHLQDQGLDTVDANRRLGFGDDERVYGCVPFILKDLGIETVQLMTNNPMKVRQLTELGVTVTSTKPAIVKSNPYNEGYLRTKAQRMAHALFNFDESEGDSGGTDGGSSEDRKGKDSS